MDVKSNYRGPNQFLYQAVNTLNSAATTYFLDELQSRSWMVAACLTCTEAEKCNFLFCCCSTSTLSWEVVTEAQWWLQKLTKPKWQANYRHCRNKSATMMAGEAGAGCTVHITNFTTQLAPASSVTVISNLEEPLSAETNLVSTSCWSGNISNASSNSETETSSSARVSL